MHPSTSFSKDEKYFLLRRIHSLSGVLPIGMFFLFHLFSNAKSTHGPEVYNKVIEEIASMPYLPIIEILAIALPILFHVILGIVIYLSSKNNTFRYSYFANWRYLFQRVTGLIGIAYLGYHVWETRIEGIFTGQHVSFQTMQELINEPGMFWFYLVGSLSLTYHFANGLWTFLITWGVTISPRAQKLSGYMMAGLFVVLSAVWVHILLNFRYPQLFGFLF